MHPFKIHESMHASIATLHSLHMILQLCTHATACHAQQASPAFSALPAQAQARAQAAIASNMASASAASVLARGGTAVALGGSAQSAAGSITAPGLALQLVLTPAGAHRPQQALPLASWLQQYQLMLHATAGKPGAAAASPQQALAPQPAAAPQPPHLAHLRLAPPQPAGAGGGAAVHADSMAAASTDAGVGADPQEQPFTPSAFLAEAPSSDGDGPFAGSHLRQSPTASGGGRQAAAAAAAVATAASGVLDPAIAAIGMEGCAALRIHALPPLAYHGLGREEGDAPTVRHAWTG
jgi:hypothetical protein